MPGTTKKRAKKKNKKRPSDSEMVEELQVKIHSQLMTQEFEAKVADFIKLLELKHKLKPADDGKEKILELIERLRQAELGSYETSGESAD
jgi:hypothetical protein